MRKFDPRTVLLSTLFLALALIIMNSILGVALTLTFVAIHLYIFRLDLGNLKRILRYSTALFISIIFINYFFMGKEVEYILFSLLRVLGVIFLSVSILTSLEIMDIGYAIEKLLSPLEKLRIPVGVISTVFAISLKFIPLLKEESERIVLAQKARGVDLDLMTLPEKIKNIPTLFLPVIISGIQHSINLATAMEVRGYGAPCEKSRYLESDVESSDYLYLVFSIIPLVILIIF